MPPLELTVEGFRSHRHRTTFDWRGRRLIGIVGPIGAGKSSVLDAISFALYGMTPAVEGATKTLIHQLCSESHVGLRFQVDGQVWRAVRALRRRGASGHQLERLASDMDDAEVLERVTKNELFTASRGRGAFLDDRRIRVSKCAQLRDALVGTGFPFKELSRLDLYLRQLKTMMTSSAGVRRAGAAALGLAYVACGRLDAFWEMGLSRWDMAAGALLIQEAGGLVGDLQGNSGYLERGEIAPSTPKVMPQLLEALR